jgi:hypothetical protein
VIQEEFGEDDFRTAMNELLDLRQTGTVEEYTTNFQALQYTITMHNAQYDDMFFTPQYVRGLKEDIRGAVEPQRPTTVHKASIIAKIQQGVQERSKAKYQRYGHHQKTNVPPRMENKPALPATSLWRDRQLRDYRKANNLCYSCGEKYVLGHQEVCTKRNRPQANALIVNDLDRELSEEVLNQLAAEDTLNEDFGHLSLNAITSTDHTTCIKLNTKVQDKVILILVDSGSSHSFISSQFVALAKIPTVPVPPRKVKLANGEYIVTNKKVQGLSWYCQGHTLSTDMIVLDMHPYDAILGCDWLQQNSPMQCDWEKKTLEFCVKGRNVKLQGITQQPLQLQSISATKVFNSTKGNDVWAFVLVDHVPDKAMTSTTNTSHTPEINKLLSIYGDVFTDPKSLPPPRAYDHSIPLLPGSIPINSKPYHYYPLHKTEIERQVQELLQTGLIAHSHSPFASPVL